MNAAQRMLDVTANNLANASTNGFKSDGIQFRDALEANLYQGSQSIGQMSFGATAEGETTNFNLGPISQTGNDLDVAIGQSEGAFKVDIGNGTAFTRDGSFRMDNQNQLVDREGHPVLDVNDNPITIDGKQVSIQKNGDVVVDGQVAGTIGIFSGTFKKEGQNLYSSKDAQPNDQIGLIPKSLEGSNVNPVAAMVQMITLNRAFDMSQKAVQQHDELTQKLIQSLNGQ